MIRCFLATFVKSFSQTFGDIISQCISLKPERRKLNCHQKRNRINLLPVVSDVTKLVSYLKQRSTDSCKKLHHAVSVCESRAMCVRYAVATTSGDHGNECTESMLLMESPLNTTLKRV